MDVLEILKRIAILLEIPVREGRDTFGQKFLDIDTRGLQYLHEVSVDRGHVEVAEYIRQMLARGEQREMET
jgi:hypothetical protein